MDDDDARALREAVRGLLEKRSDVRAAMEMPQGYDEDLWATLCGQIGVAALAVPEAYGGVGAGLGEVAVVLEELGRGLTPAPMLGSALCAYALLLSGDEEACSRWLPAIAEGTVAALAWAGEQGWSSLACTASESIVDGECRYRLDGTACYVLDGDIARLLVVLARAGDEVGLFEVDRDQVAPRHTPGMDPTRRFAAIEFSGSPARRLGTACYPIDRLRALALTMLSAEQVGLARRALELTVDYTRQRHQFGRPIGSFQALKHRMADAHVRVEAARSASWAALAAGSGTTDTVAPVDHAAAAVAKVVCSEAVELVTAEMIQLHGGIAITWEHDAHLYFKRAYGSARLFGSVTEAIGSVEWLRPPH
ncbi:acyl-CoA dehydrogenase family protein [Amycolatopsis pigmentata]|uniref:Acyl-CoA dehydrogenase family protein n=1 Tax=Amycolatopsis pigmentata TaxID=450801 RepID=A0ABW5FSL4_9PSEU